MNLKTLTFILSDEKDQNTAGKANIRIFSEKDRILRGIRISGIFVSLAIFSILIPIAHFLLVPAFLIAAPLAGRKTFSRKSIVESLEGICPSCANHISENNLNDFWPKNIDCRECFTRLRGKLT